VRVPFFNQSNRAWRFYRVSRLLFSTIWVMYRERRRVLKARKEGNREVRPNVEVLRRVAIRFRETALAMGGLLIKLGQFLSARADLLPQAALEELVRLQDEVTPVPFRQIAASIERAFGRPINEVYAYVEEKPTAAASLGQVHRGKLPGGEDVAIKIQRPNVHQLVRADLSALRFVIWVITRLKRNTSQFIDLWALYKEFSRTVYEELDYVAEGRNAERFARAFADDPTVKAPKIYWDFATRRVLTMEWIDGMKISNYQAIEDAGLNRKQVAERVVSTYFKQILEEGFFHADPHPGNLFVQAHPTGPITVFVDFGMMGTISSSLKRGLRKAFLSVAGKDARGLIESLDELGFIGPGADLSSLEKAADLMLGQFYGRTMGQALEVDPGDVFSEVDELLYNQPFRLPYQFIFFGRMMGMLSGLATGLSKDFNFTEVALPYAQAFMTSNGTGGVSGVLGLIREEALPLLRSMVSLPKVAEQLLARADRGDLRLQVNLDPLRSDLRQVERSVNRLGYTLMFVFSLAGGVVLEVAHQPAPGWFCLGLAGLSGIAVVWRRRATSA
jgi:predicted unusual protein kinase regulating ubiquinone biosynthesis (AarF/ABC1/UbiB family)